MSEAIAKQWLQDSVDSAGLKDLNLHMGMISKRVTLTGVPGFETIDFDAWYTQCRDQFENNKLKSIAYKGFNLISTTEYQIMFNVFETVVGTDGALNEQVIEMLLEKEKDDVWRLVQERVLIENEAMRDHDVS